MQKETQEELLTTLQAIQKKLASIESLLQRMPELLAAVFFTMKDEYEAAKWCGKKAKDISIGLYNTNKELRAEGLYVRGVIPNNTDIDTVTEPGIWLLQSGYTYTHSPFDSSHGGILTVIKYSNNVIFQIVSTANGVKIFTRTSTLGTFPAVWGGYEQGYVFSTGDNTDRTADIMLMLTTYGYCHLGPGVFSVTGISMPDNTAIRGSGESTIVKLAASVEGGSAIRVRSGCSASNIKIIGGDNEPTLSSTVGTRHGISFVGTKISGQSGGDTFKRSTITNCTISNFEGGGITLTKTGVDLDSNVIVSNCFIDHCGAGIYIPYYSEFHRICNCSCTRNWYGCVDNGGNNNFSNCDFSGNKVGILIDNTNGKSPNNSHGTFSSCTVNHAYSEAGLINKGIAINLIGVSYGEVFVGMQIFYGAIIIDGCYGVRFIGANVGSMVPITITDSTVTTFADCTFKEGPDHADSTFTQSGNTVLKFTDCFLRDGTVYDPMA